ncbi:MAG: N-acetyltransferase family protein [Eisenbergiella sp.]
MSSTTAAASRLSWRRRTKGPLDMPASLFTRYDAYAATVELSVYVDHEYRGRKIGDALMEELLRIAKENGEVHAIISVITADNAASIRLHEKFGFQFCGITREVGRKFGRWLDAAFYQLNI